MAQNYASKFSDRVVERFSRESQVAPALSNTYNFTGTKSVVVYTVPTVPMNNYNRTGTGNRYGTLTNLGTTIQTMTVTQDRSFTFSIDKGDRVQSQMVLEAGRALARQLKEVVIPEFDAYVFRKAAQGAGNSSSATVTNPDDAYQQFLTAQETMSDANVPDEGRIAFVSYGFYNQLKLSDNFTRDSDTAMDRAIKGTVGYVDGVKIVRVPKFRLPSTTSGSGSSATTTYASFILMHPASVIAPKQLWEYKIHEDPVGVSGWVVEGRFLYDAFVLETQADAIYYQGPALT